MPNITTTEVNDALATIIAAEALGYLKSNTVMTRLVTRDWDNEVATHGQVVKIPFRGSLSTNAKAANTVVTLQAPADTSVSVTLNQHKEVSFLIEDIAKALARPDYLQGYMEDGMKVIAEDIDGYLLNLYSGFSQAIDATTGLGEVAFRNGRRLLNSAKAPLADRWAVLHEDAEYELLGIEKFTNRDYAELQGSPAGLLDAYVGRFMGFRVFLNQGVKVAAGQCKNLFFQRQALALVTRPLPPAPDGMGVIQTVMDEDGVGVRVTLSYNADHLGVQVTIDVLYGAAELRDAFGVVVSTDEL